MAIALRETLEQPGHRAALATPDRALAIRVAAELRRWNVAVEDFGRSAAVRLARRPPRPPGGRRGGAGFPSRPRARPPGSSAAPARSRSRRGRARRRGARDRGVARTRPRPGLDGLADAFSMRRAENSRHTPRPRRRLSPRELGRCCRSPRAPARCLCWISAAVARRRTVSISLPSRRRIAGRSESCSSPPTRWRMNSSARWRCSSTSSQQRMAAAAFAAASSIIRPSSRASPASAPSRRRPGATPVSRSWACSKPACSSFDRIVVGGLDEGVWPARVETDAFLNRPMRARLGLASPEQRHRPNRARFRPAPRCRRRGDHAGSEAQRLAHGAVALSPAPQGVHRR